jgi:spore coat polysaccharide biosynthesis protein SpsF
MKSDIICVIQARMNSSRFPAKVVAPIVGNPLLYYVIKRVALSELKKIVVTTTKMQVDAIIEFISQKNNVDCIRGNESDVLARYVQAAELYSAKAVVRITADCPLVDPEIINKVLKLYEKNPASDYIFIEGYPIGLGAVELISSSALKTSYNETEVKHIYYREHVMTYIIDNPDKFSIYIKKTSRKVQKDYRLCVDELDDLEVVRKIYEHFLPRLDFSSEDIIQYLDSHPNIPKINQHVKQKAI